jgi:hypothetical protein
MIKRFSKLALIISLILVTGTYSCKKTLTEPTITTVAISNILPTTATGGGDILNANGETITARGVCWNTDINPTIANFKSSNGTGAGAFRSELVDLKSLTVYHVRAYETVAGVTTYGNEVSFKTSW